MADWLLPARDTGRIRCRTAYAILVMTHGPGTLTGRTPVTVNVLPSGLRPGFRAFGHNLRPARVRDMSWKAPGRIGQPPVKQW